MPGRSPKPRGAAAAAGNAIPRRRGLKRNADRTRDRILRGAITEFAAKGYSGARVEGICRAAKANPRMLYHHFGDKDGLYLAVLEEVMGDLRSEELKLAVDQSKVEPLEGIMQLFDFIHGHFGDHPELIHLLSGENLLKARFLRRSDSDPDRHLAAHRAHHRPAQGGPAPGVIRRGIDPLHLYVMMVALSYFHRSNVHTLSAIFRADLQAPAWRAQHQQAATDMLLRYLRAD